MFSDVPEQDSSTQKNESKPCLLIILLYYTQSKWCQLETNENETRADTCRGSETLKMKNAIGDVFLKASHIIEVDFGRWLYQNSSGNTDFVSNLTICGPRSFFCEWNRRRECLALRYFLYEISIYKRNIWFISTSARLTLERWWTMFRSGRIYPEHRPILILFKQIKKRSLRFEVKQK